MAWYAQHLEALSSIPSSMGPLMTPVLRTQSLGPDYSAPPAYTRSQQRHELHVHGRRRDQGSNPLMPLLSNNFQSYRKKQAGKPDQKWPEEVEGFFLDGKFAGANIDLNAAGLRTADAGLALLLIPQMGRDKYTMKKTLWGRNQLIGEYLWIASLQGLSPGAEPDPQVLEIKDSGKMRKRVSSHIQVLKSFFKAHRCCK
jgi:transcriptional enhancer factor